jgi:hypothetical protein
MLWLAYDVVEQVPALDEASGVLVELAKLVHDVRAAESTERGMWVEKLERVAAVHLGDETAQRVARTAVELAEGKSIEQILGGAPGYELRAIERAEKELG